MPDRFDLWVRKARSCADPARQLDYVLGALAGLPEWHFLNVGTVDQPQPALAELEGERLLLVFSDVDRVREMAESFGMPGTRAAPPVITIPTAGAMAWCLNGGPLVCDGLFINPGEDAVIVPREQAEIFAREWQAREGRLASGFWIPNLTTEEEDFWQENGL